ncbi:MAG: hypothetical protein RLZZ540_3252, partial [Bacteroidota bacterium]
MKKLFAILSLSALFFSCKETKTEENPIVDTDLITVTGTQFQSGAMEIATPVEQDFDVTVKATGKIDVPPQNRAQITSFMGGYI